MQQLLIWYNVNGLVINTEKTITVLFHTWKNKGVLKPHIIFEGVDIMYKYRAEYLVLHMTEDIKWDVHIKHTSPQLKRSCYVMQSLNGKTSVSILRSMYFVTFLHIYGMAYCFVEVMGRVKIIFKPQKKFMRLINSVGRDTSCRAFITTLNILSLSLCI